ncbi:MAG: hypothetical protein ACKVQS_12025 [Fimbriimonadaceae bacterium]
MKLELPKTPAERILAFLLVIVCVVIFMIIYPFQYHPNGAARKTQMFSQLKQLGIATSLYLEDFDKQFPHATSMPTFRAQIIEYTKYSPDDNSRPEIFKAMPGHYTEPQFNFNLAGVKAPNEQLPLLPSGKLAFEQTILAFSAPIDKESNVRVIVVHANTSTRAFMKNNPITFTDLLGPQFNRKGVTLAPADYLANQDPLK